MLEAAAGDYPRATKVILMTNIGLLAHWNNKELVVFAHDLYSLAPIAQARVRVFTNKNQVIASGVTDERGIAQMGDFNTRLGDPSIVLVESGKDYTYLELAAREDKNLPYDSEMLPYDRNRYDGFIYADRDLYRPGEPVHLRWIVRKNYGDALAGVPLKLTITKPNGKSLLEQPATLSKLGTGALDVPTQKAYPTGKYEVALSVPGSNQALGTYSFQLEEFVPNRIKASIEIPEKDWIGADAAHKIVVVGRHLFGAPAEGRKAEARVTLERGLESDRWKGFNFDNDSAASLDAVDLGEATTDKDGRAEFEFSYKKAAELTFPLSVTVGGSVYELGGRKVAAHGEALLFPSELCLGLAAESGQKDGEIRIRALAMKPDESPADLGEAEVTIERQVWNYSVRDYSSYQEPTWSGKYEPVATRPVALKDGLGLLAYSVHDFGMYRVRLHSPKTKQYSSLLFYYYGGRCEVTQSDEPSLIHLKLTKPVYKVGETAELTVKSPFDGKALVVIQGETIRKMLPVVIRKGVGVLRFKVAPEDYPNAWLEATVVHAIEKNRNQVYPFASFKMIKLPVEDPARRINISLGKIPAEVRPAQPYTLNLKATSGRGLPVQCEITLAAVDEGIHSIKGYTNPDPLNYFGRQRRPDYRRAFYYDKVAYDFDQPAPAGDEDAGARLGRPAANWIKTVALWSGVVKTDERGRAKITFNLPEFNGELRLVAVAVGARATGMQAGSLIVRRPYMMQTSMPRFLLPGDKARCRVTLYNTTDKPCRAVIQWAHGGLLQGGEGRQEVKLAARGEANVLAEFSAGRAVGQGRIEWRAEFLDPATSKTLDKLAETAPIPVAEPAAYQMRQDMKVLHAGEETTLTNTFFLDDELARMDLLVGAQPQLRLAKALRYVVDYPYGCVEQTTSKLIPLYLLRKSTGLVQSSLKESESLDQYIKAGIDRLFAMQTASGGLAFWPGGSEPYPYGSIYALHGLTLIRNGRDFALPQNNYAILQEYVRHLAQDWGDGSRSTLYQRAYATYVLSLGGDQKAIGMIERFDSLTLPTSARYLLAAALARNTHDTDRVKLYLTSAPAAPWTVREPDGTLNSDVRNTAVELMALGQMGAPRAQMAARADALGRYLESQRYGTTQEFAFVTAAMCDYLDALTTDIQHAAATIREPGKESKISGREDYKGSHKGPGAKFSVKNSGRTDLYLSVTSRGVPAAATSEEIKEGMAVRRRFYTSDAKPLAGANFKQGESYIIELEIYTKNDVRNVVVADLLPAGLEVENPRLKQKGADEEGSGKLPHENIFPSHYEIRDERQVLVYDSLNACSADTPATTHHFYYVVNAVTPGEFTYPPLEAECMYDPAVRGSSKAEPMKVLERK